MDTETLFTATKWEILKLLEQQPQAPTDIAATLKSSLANVSQQLRLLEMAGLVTSERAPDREKGKPRTQYRLTGNLSYLIATTDSFVDKKVVHLSDRNQVVLRIWFLEDPQLRYALEKAFWELEPQLGTLQKLTFSGIEDGKPILEVRTTRKLQSTIDVGGQFGSVHLRAVAEPVGYVLYANGA